MGWLDMHTHLHMLEQSPEAALKEAQLSGVERCITIGTTPDDLDIVQSTAEAHYPFVACALGIHPHDSSHYSDAVDQTLRKKMASAAVIAVGEIGLDYYYENSEPEQQKVAFRRQMQIAADFGLPVEIHTRDAEPDTIEILKEFKGRVQGVIHCFTGSQWLADEAVALGYNISISGIVTFKNAESIREVLKSLPLSKIFVETDAPFLAPVPMRGKKNLPAYLVHTGQFVAQLKGVSDQELQMVLKENARRLFPKWNLDTV